MNLNVSLPPPDICEVWDYNKADRKNIQRSIKTCHQARLFINLTINERVELFSKTQINIFRNYIPKKRVKSKYDEASTVDK